MFYQVRSLKVMCLCTKKEFATSGPRQLVRAQDGELQIEVACPYGLRIALPGLASLLGVKGFRLSRT